MADNGVNILELMEVSGVASGLLVLLATWIAQRAVAATLRGLGSRITERRLQLNQLATVVSFAMYLAGMAVALALSFNLSKDVLLALGGTAAVTAGFALKDLAASILAGVVIIVDRPFQVGDRVTFGGVYGEVTHIGLRSVRLVTLDDNVVTIPTSKFLTDAVASGNWGALDMLVQMDFHVGHGEDFILAKHIVEEALHCSRFVYNHKPWAVLVNQVFVDAVPAIRLRAKAYVLDVQHEKAFETDVTERVLLAFQAAGVHPPQLVLAPALKN